MFHAWIKPLAFDTASVSGDSNTAEFALLVRVRECLIAAIVAHFQKHR
jgi:hypothetical protein